MSGSPRSGSDVAPRVVNALSVDVEEYFQVSAFEGVIRRSDWTQMDSRVESSTNRLLEIFDSHGLRGTFFILGWIGEHHPSLVRRIHESGHEVASHGYDHRRVSTLSADEFRADVQRSKAILEDLTGERVIGYRAPSFSIMPETRWALDVLMAEGFLYDSSVFPIRHDRYGWTDSPRFPWTWSHRAGVEILEFPISTLRAPGFNLPFVGGGYLRLLPLPYIRWGFRRLNEIEGQPVVLYVHPWEIDPGQPRQQVAGLTAIRHYHNLDRTERRLGMILSEFDFAPMSQVLGF